MVSVQGTDNDAAGVSLCQLGCLLSRFHSPFGLRRDNGGMNRLKFFEGLLADDPKVPVKVSSHLFHSAIEEADIRTLTWWGLEDMLADEPDLL